MEVEMINFHKNAEIYMQHSCSIIPLEAYSKTPYKNFKWGTDKVTLETLTKYPAVCNIGLILGRLSDGIVDLDFDCMEAITIGNKMFNDLVSFGRKSTPNAHRLAKCSNPEKTVQFKIPADVAEKLGFDKTVILELRGEGGYTMVPDSMHPSGEQLSWTKGFPDKFPEHDWNDLLKKAAVCAFLAVVFKMYPTQSGSRDNICLALAGALLRADLTPEEADNLIIYIAEQKGDEEAHKRGKSNASKQRLDNDEDVIGLPTLCELLGIPELESTLSKWLYGALPKKSNELAIKVEEINKEYFAVRNEGGKFLIGTFEEEPLDKGVYRKKLAFQGKGDFINWYSNQLVTIGVSDDGKPIMRPIGKEWIKHPNRRQYDRVVFMPGQEVSGNLLNLWQGYGIEPKKGSWRKMLRHIWRVLAKRDPVAFRYIIMWCAWSVQNPDIQAEVALVFRGGKGTGKGTFCNALVLIFGHHGLAISSSQHLTGRFNSHLRDCVLLFADEAIVPNDKQAENIMKSLITEPKITIEKKGVDIIPTLNHLHIVMASNDEWVVPASADERRYAVFDVSDEMVGHHSWFKSIHSEINNGGLEAILHSLLNIDLGNWHPRKHIPVNSALNSQRMQSLKGLEKIWFDWLSIGQAVGEPKGENTVFIPTRLFSKICSTTDRASSIFLSQMGCTQERIDRLGRGWVTLPLTEARKIWNDLYFDGGWDNTENWEPCSPDEVPF